MKLHLVLACLLSMCVCAGCLLGADATLKVGDAAPALTVSKFVKGEAVTEFAKDKIYIIECWATWCGPCRAAIPHVSELQKKYADKGVIVIGVDVWENDPAKVEAFVKQMGEKMDYRVALDDVKDGEKNGKMAEGWLKAAGRNGIPCSFVVKEGKIAWIGHPSHLEEELPKIIDAK